MSKLEFQVPRGLAEWTYEGPLSIHFRSSAKETLIKEWAPALIEVGFSTDGDKHLLSNQEEKVYGVNDAARSGVVIEHGTTHTFIPYSAIDEVVSHQDDIGVLWPIHP
jgi:hypothetical protein